MEKEKSHVGKKLMRWLVGIACFFAFASCLRSFTGGPAMPKVKKRVTEQIQEAFDAEQLHGKLTVTSVYHIGFSLGGVTAKYTYTEKVNGKEITVSDTKHEFHNNGERVHSDIGKPLSPSVFTEKVKHVSLEQEKFKKYSKMIQSEFEKYETKQLAFEKEITQTDESSNVTPVLSHYFEDTEFFPAAAWFKEQVKKNVESGIPDKQAFKGYYQISPIELLSRELVTYHINFTFTDFGKDTATIDDEKVGHKIIDNILQQIDVSKFPNAKYVIDYDVHGDVSNSWSIQDRKYFQVIDGKIVSQSDWGELTSIEKWNTEEE